MSSEEKENEMRIEGTNKLRAGGRGRPKAAVVEYDFAVDGGAEGAINLRGDSLPKGAVIVDSLVSVETAPTGASAECKFAIAAESAGDLQAAKKVGEAPWSTATPKRGAVTATSTPVVTTAARNVVATISGAAAIGGKFKVVVWYLELG
jgi:hypothetical protein